MRPVIAALLVIVILPIAGCRSTATAPQPAGEPATPPAAASAPAETGVGPAGATSTGEEQSSLITPTVPISYVQTTYVLQFHPTDSKRLWVTFGPQMIPVEVDEAGARPMPDKITQLENHFAVALTYPKGGDFFVGGQGMLRRSRDDGATWEPVPELNDATIDGLVADPGAPATLYALVNRRGVMRTTDSGQTWSTVAEALPSHAFGLWVLAADPLRLATYDHDAGKLLASDDQGKTWAVLDAAGLDARPYQISLAGDGRLYAATERGLHMSSDRGATWTQPDQGKLKELFGVAVDPGSPDTVLALGKGGNIYRSFDGGKTWAGRRPTQPSP